MIDVLIVGAGPAGSVAALRLARAGVRVTMIDRSTFPRAKLCGDTLNPGTLAILSRLGLRPQVERSALRVSGMMVSGPAGASVSADYPGSLYGLSLPRTVLDQVLVDAAVAAGARIETSVAACASYLPDGRRVSGVRVRHLRHRYDMRARLVIAADGRASRLATQSGLGRLAASPRRWAYGAYYQGVGGTTSRGEMHIRTGGYIGVAPLPGGLTNVCVVQPRRPRCPADAHVPPASVMDTVIREDSMLRDRFVAATRVSAVSVLGPLAFEPRGAGRPGLLLAGDAAGFVDPMTGDGMRFAIRGGELAAEAALLELMSGRPAHRALAAARRREFVGKWRINRALRTLVGSPHAVTLAALASRWWALPVERLIAIAGDVGVARASTRSC